MSKCESWTKKIFQSNNITWKSKRDYVKSRPCQLLNTLVNIYIKQEKVPRNELEMRNIVNINMSRRLRYDGAISIVVQNASAHEKKKKKNEMSKQSSPEQIYSII
jgi:hypothetical protein